MGDPLESYTVGDVVQFPTPDGQGQFAGVVLQLRGDTPKDQAVLFDFNHPLAGQPVTFEVHLIGVL
jgi:FKBP-type peptidyl-prolyl cis-trans isomerase SlpA